MRRAAKIDATQRDIVSALRKAGATVAITSTVGDGFPDLVIGYRGRNVLIECKDGAKPPSARKLTPDQVDFHAKWRGPICVVESVDAALQVLANLGAAA